MSEDLSKQLAEREVPASERALTARGDFALSPDFITIQQEQQDAEGIDLRAYWGVLVRRKWTVLLFLAIVLLAAVTATFLMTPMYRASLTVQINTDTIKVVQFQGVTPTENPWNKDEFYNTQYELLQSRSLAETVVAELKLTQNPVFRRFAEASEENDGPGLLQRIAAAFGMDKGAQPPSPVRQTLSERITTLLLSWLTVEPVKDSRLVRLHFLSPDRHLSAEVLNAWADAFVKLNLERRFGATAYARSFLEERLAQLKTKLEASESELAKYARDRGIINMGDKENTVTQELKQLNTALIAAREKRIQAEAMYRQVELGDHQGLPQVMESPVIQELKGTLSELETDYQQNLKIFKPAYPKMQRLQSQMAEVRQAISDEIGHIRQAIRTQYESALNNEQLLQTEYEQAKKNVLTLQDRSIDYRVLEREVDTNQELYKGLLQRYKEVGVAGGVGSNNISVVDAAQIPRKKFKPSLAKNVLLALVFGLFGGVGLAFFFEHLDDTIKAPDQLERSLKLTTLGIIPAVRGEEFAGPLAFLAIEDPRSAFAEAYRSVRTALQFVTSDGFPSTLLVTSASMSEGKSTTALSLAINVAQTGKRVLLIDADLRKPSLHRTLGLDNQRGLTNCLTGEARPVDVVQPTPVENLFTILTGPLPPNPAELLSGSRMMSLMSLSVEKFAFVVVDGPPVLGLADALILGNIMDGTLLVVESGSTRTEHAKGAIKRLASSRTRLLGAILSKFDARGSSYGYHQGYYYYDYGTAQKKLT